MSEINNNTGANFPENTPGANEHNRDTVNADAIAFKGELTDLRYDPLASINKAFIDKMIMAKIGDQHNVTFGSKEISSIQANLDQLNINPNAAKKAMALAPAFQGLAEVKGYANPDAVALALEHYAATVEFAGDSA